MYLHPAGPMTSPMSLLQPQVGPCNAGTSEEKKNKWWRKVEICPEMKFKKGKAMQLKKGNLNVGRDQGEEGSQQHII